MNTSNVCNNLSRTADLPFWMFRSTLKTTALSQRRFTERRHTEQYLLTTPLKLGGIRRQSFPTSKSNRKSFDTSNPPLVIAVTVNELFTNISLVSNKLRTQHDKQDWTEPVRRGNISIPYVFVLSELLSKIFGQRQRRVGNTLPGFLSSFEIK